MSDVVAPDAVAAFAAANDATAATSKKLEKQKILATYFRSLPDKVLADGVRFAAGKAFAVTDERTTGVSSAGFRDAVAALFNESAEAWRARAIKSGETGEALAGLWQERGSPGAVDAEALSLSDFREVFDALALVSGSAAKQDLLRDLLARCVLPRSAAYVGKVINGDLRTGAREGVLHGAIAEAFEVEADAVRRAVLLLGDLGEVAVLARHKRLDGIKFRLFHPLGFMLATPRETSEAAADFIGKTDRTWTAEDKLDGIRAQIHKQGVGDLARISIYSRTLDRSDNAFPDIVEQARQVPGDWILDGEIVPYDEATKSVTAFANVQKRLGRVDPSAEVLEQYPCRFVAFDLLYLNEALLIDSPQDERRTRLVSLLEPQSAVLKLETTGVTDQASIDEAFAAAREAKNEGLILKDPQSRYAPGRRGQGWIKLKTHLPTLDVVVTAAEYGHGKRRDSLSDYTFAIWSDDPAEGGTLLNIGKAYSGVTDAEIAMLTERFLEIQTSSSGRVFKVRPEVVLEIAFDAIQKSRRHASGFALRFPRIKRIRWDRSPESADQLARVVEIFEDVENFNKVGEPAKAEKLDPQLMLFGP